MENIIQEHIIHDKAFYIGTSIVYPPFKNGFYMEEYFVNYVCNNNTFYDRNGRLYIPALWTNFQLEQWFGSYRMIMQTKLDEFITTHPCEKGYFTVVQHDDGPFLKLPSNTIVYGACNGDIPLPLIYEDNKDTLKILAKNNVKSFHEREILCSFVGCTTHTVRNKCIDSFSNVPGFEMIVPKEGWKLAVNKPNQDVFIEKNTSFKVRISP